MIEGPNLIREALQNGGAVEWIIRSEDFYNVDCPGEDLYSDSGKTEQTLSGVPMAVMPPGLFRKLSDTESPQGILAVVKKRIYPAEEFFFGNQTSNRFTASNVIVLDRLQDPGNIGTILRTADAAGYLGAILLKGTADIYSPKIVRAAAGSLFRLPVLMAGGPDEVIQLLRRYQKNIICTTPDCSRYYYDADLKENAAVIIGNEGSGVCSEFLAQSDISVKIPMEGSIESLNAAVAAGILMYESVRQRYQVK